MCGIFGSNSVGRLTEIELKFFANLGVLNTFRGRDSTGIFDYIPYTDEEVKNKAQCTVYWKDTAPSWEFTTETVEDNLAKKGRWEKDHPELVVGHARSATKGAVSVKNAHPFAFKSLIGVHNGTINGAFKNSTKFETDSEALYFNIAEMGLDEALKEAVSSSYSAAYALSYLDIDTKTLHLIRNKERPLAIFNNGGCGHFSSDWKDLFYLTSSAALAGKDAIDWNKAVGEGKVVIPANTIVSLPEDILLTCETGKGLKEFIVKKIEPPKKVYAYEHQNNRSGFFFREGSGNVPFVPGQTTGNGSFGTVSDSPPIDSLFHFMPINSFKRAVAEKANQTNNCYAIELDGWLSPHYMKGLVFWRLMNREAFKKELISVKSEYNNAYFADKLEDASMTRGDMKRINKGDYSWIDECKYKIFYPNSVVKVREQRLTDWYSKKGLKFLKDYVAKETPPSNVVPIVRKEPDMMMYGNGLGVQYTRPKAEYLDVRQCGCKLCGHKPLVFDHLYWLNKDEYLCENDQIVIATAYKDEKKNLLRSQVLIEELVKFTDTWQKEERKMYNLN